ncbi:low choriolytic enzyme-like [Nelusetta ayraudi]|uniref:low choriolytic enzyme-like n=1 Tax=Nelusetta ayraudi TaxID=303726 RepID=UPI003F71C7B1
MDFRTVGSLLLLVLLLGVCAAQQEEDPRSDSDELSQDNLENEDMTTTILRVNKDSESFLLEGDIEIPSTRNGKRCTSKHVSCRWPKIGGEVVVPYEISPKYNEERTEAIKMAMIEIEQKTCVNFVPHTNQRSYLRIKPRSGCSSLVGMMGGPQVVSLRMPGCMKHGIILHELLHALGFNHEHTREDRDKYVKILWDNMHRFQAYNFKKQESDYLGTKYDYDSIMHYGRTAFGQNRKETIVPLQENVSIGQRERLSHNDILKVNLLYKCWNY